MSVAFLSLGLLLFLRLNIGFDTGLPLQELATNARYDLAPVPLMLGVALLLLGRPSLPRATLAGALCGLAMLLQFYGIFMLPVLAAFLWFEPLSVRERLRLIATAVVAGWLVLMPYGGWALANFDLLKLQARTI